MTNTIGACAIGACLYAVNYFHLESWQLMSIGFVAGFATSKLINPLLELSKGRG